MQNYLVYMPGGQERVEQQFSTVYYKIATDLWAIGSDLKTCVDVCNALGVDDPNTMVVVSINEFYGRYDGALWQKIESWSRG